MSTTPPIPGVPEPYPDADTLPAEDASPRLNPHALERVTAALQDVADPTRIGPYFIIRKVGEGGMGTVYEAEQREPVRRTVALKVIKLGMDSKQVVARFRAEQQAMAQMNHPNIAMVLHSDVSERGQPYFVMEYVRGEPITTYCDRHGLDLRGRLALFRDVCAAVQHAHDKGILHRDVKPGNVLVAVTGGTPVVKVIDFGLAKATQARLVEETVYTERGVILGTPEYMSPEQAENNELGIDYRSDVYSLGVLLYELLTACLPFRPGLRGNASYGEIQRAIREEQSPAPAARLSLLSVEELAEVARKRRTTPSDLLRVLRGPLRRIPLRALCKDRTERYPSASAMSEDVANYLEGRPLRPGSVGVVHTARRLVWRSRRIVTALAGAACLLGIGFVVSRIWEGRRSVPDGGGTLSSTHPAATRSAATTAPTTEPRTPPELNDPSLILVSIERDRSRGEVKVLTQNGWVPLPHDQWVTVDVPIDGNGNWTWTSTRGLEHSRSSRSQYEVTLLQVYHSEESGMLTWRCLAKRNNSQAAPSRPATAPLQVEPEASRKGADRIPATLPDQAPSPKPAVPPATLEVLGQETNRCGGRLSVMTTTGRVFITPGQWTDVEVQVDQEGYWHWGCDEDLGERSRSGSPRRMEVNHLRVLHTPNDHRRIDWVCYVSSK